MVVQVPEPVPTQRTGWSWDFWLLPSLALSVGHVLGVNQQIKDSVSVSSDLFLSFCL